jgi:uroporphyrinogen-III synthase
MNKLNILITRAADQCWETVNLFSEAGFTPYCLPLIETLPLEAQFAQNSYDYMLFTSPAAVRWFSPYAAKIKTRAYIAVGSVTAEKISAAFGVEPDKIIIPANFSADGLEERLADVDLAGKKILAPGPVERVKDLSGFFAGKGASYEPVAIYKTVPVRHDIDLKLFFSQYKINVLCFFSPSAVRSFFDQGALPEGVRAAAVGHTTAKALIDQGIVDCIVPDEYTAKGLIDAIKGR